MEYLRRAVAVLAGIESKLEREVYIMKVASEQGLPKEAVAAEVASYIRKQQRSDEKKEIDICIGKQIESGVRPRDDINPESRSHPKEAKAEEGIIFYILANSESIKQISPRLPPEKFCHRVSQRIYESLLRRERPPDKA